MDRDVKVDLLVDLVVSHFLEQFANVSVLDQLLLLQVEFEHEDVVEQLQRNLLQGVDDTEKLGVVDFFVIDDLLSGADYLVLVVAEVQELIKVASGALVHTLKLVGL